MDRRGQRRPDRRRRQLAVALAIQSIIREKNRIAIYSAVATTEVATGTDDTDTVLAWMRGHPVDDFYARGATLRADSRLVHDFYLVEVKQPAESKGPWDVY